MKWISTVLIMALIISLTLTGCGGGDKETVDTGGNAPVTGTVTQGKVEPGDGSKINPGTGKSNQSMELPAEFPTDVLPVLDDAQIDHVMKNETNKSINITFTTGKSLEEATAFYKEVMNSGKVTLENGGADNYAIGGSKGDYAVAISIVVVQGKTYVQLDATPSAK